jgi:hypothetical protein
LTFAAIAQSYGICIAQAAAHGEEGCATGGRKKAAKRELIDTGSDKRLVRRGAKGRFKESDDVGKSLSADRRKRPR